jgi:hypothetical protein
MREFTVHFWRIACMFDGVSVTPRCVILQVGSAEKDVDALSAWLLWRGGEELSDGYIIICPSLILRCVTSTSIVYFVTNLTL